MKATRETARQLDARKVKDALVRFDCFRRHFGSHAPIVEDAIHSTIRHICPDFRGARWSYFELSNGGFYMAPDLGHLRVCVASNGYNEPMSADAVGVTVCLIALRGLSFQIPTEIIRNHRRQSHVFALEHCERDRILAAAW